MQKESEILTNLIKQRIGELMFKLTEYEAIIISKDNRIKELESQIPDPPEEE